MVTVSLPNFSTLHDNNAGPKILLRYNNSNCLLYFCDFSCSELINLSPRNIFALQLKFIIAGKRFFNQFNIENV